MYILVTANDAGRIDSYSLNLPASTSQHEAEVTAKAELPSDAVPGKVVTVDTCKYQTWTSPTLANVFGQGVVVVAYLPALDPSSGDPFEVGITYEDPNPEFNC